MPVTSATPVKSHTGNGVTTVFPYDFRILKNTDLKVTVDGVTKTLTTDYTVSGVGDSGGGNVTFVAAPANNTAIVLQRNASYDRVDTDYQRGGGFDEETVDKDFDRAVMLIQQLKAILDRVPQLKAGSTLTQPSLPDPVSQRFLRWKSDLSGLENIDIATLGSLAVSDFARTYLDDATLAATLASMGFSANVQSLLQGANYAAIRTLLGLVIGADVQAYDADIPTVSASQAEMEAGTEAALRSVSPLRVAQAIAVGSAGYTRNVGLSASVAANALTIALKGKDGNDPSATNPVELAFRNATAATGDYSVLSITSALSLTVSSGSTLGTTSGSAARLWVVLFNDGGTARLGVINCSTPTVIYQISDGNLASSTAEGGAGAADSAGVIYTGTAVASKAMRVLGYLEITEATAGTWATAHTKLQLWTPGMKLPGDTVQSVTAVVSTLVTVAVTMPYDNTIPQQSTESGIVVTAPAITPTSEINHLHHKFVGWGASDTAGRTFGTALFQDSTENALAVTTPAFDTAGAAITALLHQMRAGTTASTVFKIGCGMNVGGNLYINGDQTGAVKYGGVSSTRLTVTEIQA